jgi:hypothetical protein
MAQRCCRFCQKQFERSRFHPEQTVCSSKPCQQQRRCRSRKEKLAVDPEYRDVCRDSARKWRANHAGYWKQYRARTPEAVARNRLRQRQRDLRQRLADLANNNSALDIKPSVAAVWWVGPVALDLRNLANNNLAAAQVFILQGPTRPRPLPAASCKQHPSGVPPVLAPYSRQDAGFAGP